MVYNVLILLLPDLQLLFALGIYTFLMGVERYFPSVKKELLIQKLMVPSKYPRS